MPGQSTSARRKDALVLSGCSVVLLVVALPVVSMMDDAWGANALSYNVVHTLVNLVGVDIDVAVVFPVGVCLGWLVLFLLDRSKRVQALILAITGLGFVYILVRFGRWATTVDWLEHLGVFVLGALLGVVTGLAGAFSRRSVREFPVAAAGLYSVATVVTVISFFEVHLAYKSPLDAFPAAQKPPVDASLLVTDGLFVDGLSAFLFVVVLATFVQYSDRKDVTLVAPTGQSETVVLAGLFDSIRKRPEGHAIERDVATMLSDVVGAVRSGHRPDSIGNERVVLRFKRPGALSRWVKIVSDESRAKHLGTPPFERLRKRKQRGVTELLRRGAVRVVTTAFPFELSLFAADRRRFIERIDSSDVVVLVARTPDALGDESEYIAAYREIDDIYAGSRSKRIVIGALDAEASFGDFQADRGVEPGLRKSSFRDYLRRTVFGVRCPVVPMSVESDDEAVQGSDRLIALIER